MFEVYVRLPHIPSVILSFRSGTKRTWIYVFVRDYEVGQSMYTCVGVTVSCLAPFVRDEAVIWRILIALAQSPAHWPIWCALLWASCPMSLTLLPHTTSSSFTTNTTAVFLEAIAQPYHFMNESYMMCFGCGGVWGQGDGWVSVYMRLEMPWPDMTFLGSTNWSLSI